MLIGLEVGRAHVIFFAELRRGIFLLLHIL